MFDKNPTILAVDDDAKSLAALVGILTTAGYQVHAARNGEQALADAIANPPDLILLDVCLPELTGLEVCRRLKADAATEPIPIILISAFPTALDSVAELRLGATDYIYKPVRYDELLTRVRTHLELGRAKKLLAQQTAELQQTNAQLQAEIETRRNVEEQLRQGLERAEHSRRAMLSTLEDRKQAEIKIHKFNDELEERVYERTAQLAAANKELETFSYSVSHDLKAPLRGIDGYSRLLEEEYRERLDDEGRRFIANIRHGAAQMHQLIEDLLHYSRMERREMRSASLYLPTLVHAVTTERAAVMEREGTVLRVEIPPMTAVADADGLAMVLRNLLENAFKFSRDATPPTIEIGALSENGKTLLWVRDNGIGFDMKFRERIFEIFQRLQRSEDYPGTGIGLALVQKAMQRMGGRVWAESSPGCGATFYLELPS